MKVSTNFYLQEFVDPDTYKRFSNSSIWFVDPRIITLAQFIRERLGKPCTINNWNGGGKFQYSGFRPAQCTIGASMSQHRYGRAIDLKVKSMTANEVRADIISNFDVYKKAGLTTIEHEDFAPSWVHLDIRTTNMDELKIVKP